MKTLRIIVQVIISSSLVIGLATPALAGGLTVNANSAVNLTNDADLTVGGDVTIAADGTLSVSGSSDSEIKCSGDWTNEGTFTCDSSTVTFDGSGTQDVTTGGSNWNALMVTNGSGSDVTFKDKFTTATFTCTTANASLKFLASDHDVPGSQEIFEITAASGLNLNGQDTGTRIVLGRYGGGDGDQCHISPSGGSWSVNCVNVSYSVNLNTTYINPSNSNDGGNNTNWFSTTLVRMISFWAIGYFGKVELVWKTSGEINNDGFNIYRAEEGSGGYTKLNAQLIPGLGTPTMGQTYTYTDTTVTNGKTYFYILEDVETTGEITRRGPVIAHPGLDTDGDGMTNDWEYYYGLNPNDPNDANLDPDNDGLTNYEEFLAGTNPNIIDSEEAEDSQDGIKITCLEDGTVELELNTTAFSETQKIAEGTTYQIITIPTYNHAQNDEVGKPLVPVKSILLGVDYKKDLEAELLETEKETYSDYLLYPVERVVAVKDPNDDTVEYLTYEFYKDENAYAQNIFYPGKLFCVDYSGYLRDEKIVKVEFFPIQFNPVSGELEFYKKIKLKVTLPEAEEREEDINERILPFTGEENYKIYVDEDGIYKITGSDLVAAGIDLAQINTGAIGLYHEDKQIPTILVGLEDGVFNPQDYIQFYAEGIDNYYTNENIYWLNFYSTSLAMVENAGFEGEVPVVSSFLKKVHFEENTYYWMYQEAMGDDHWFYPFILQFPEAPRPNRQRSQNVNFEIDNLADVNAEATLRVALQGIVYYDEEPPHHIYFHLNANFIGEGSWQGNEQHEVEFNFNSAFLDEGVNTLTMELPGDTGWSYEKALLNWIEVIYNRGFQVTGDSITFSHNQSEAAAFELTGFTSNDITIFDITDPQSPIQISNYQSIQDDSGTYTISFKDAGLKDYITTTSGNFKTPKKIIADEASDLRSTHNKADYIIICAPEFYETIQTLADYRTQRGLKVRVVKLEDIYDEFNYGVSEPDTIKDFLKYAYYSWQKPAPTYVLLVGDASYDYRNYYGFGYLNYVPTHMLSSGVSHETGSDNWFVCFDGEEDTAPEMLIGRFPIKTNEHLEVIINKIQDYEALNADAEWAKKILLVADDSEQIFTDISNDLSSYLTDEYTCEKLYLEGFTGSTAEFKDNLIDQINEGALILNYTGHGGTQLWADEYIMTNSDLALLYNAYQLPLVNMYTCMSGYFVYPKYYESLAEEFLTRDGGGAIAVIASSGLTTPGAQRYLAEGIFREFFLNGDDIVGSIFTRAKLYLLENASGKDAVGVIQTFNLFGDPALSLKKEAPALPDVAAPRVYTNPSTSSSTPVIVTLTDISASAVEDNAPAEVETDGVDEIDEETSGLIKTFSERPEAEQEEPEEETTIASRGSRGIIRSEALRPPQETQTTSYFEDTLNITETQSTQESERLKGKRFVFKQEPSLPEIETQTTEEIIESGNIRQLYKMANQKNQKITTLVKIYKAALQSRDYAEARFRIRLIFRILNENK